jgi:putative flippase GtrA
LNEVEADHAVDASSDNVLATVHDKHLGWTCRKWLVSQLVALMGAIKSLIVVPFANNRFWSFGERISSCIVLCTNVFVESAAKVL